MTEIYLELPTRICLIGASSTGKTELIKKMIMRCDFGSKKELEILLYSPSEITLDQKCWNLIKNKNIKFIANHLTKSTNAPDKPEEGIKRIIIFDDLDDAVVLPKWIVERFTVASHHLNESIVCISHRLKIGVVEIRSSANWIILTAAPESSLRDTCKNLGADYDMINKYLSNCTNLVESSPGQWKSYNHVVIRQSFCVDGDGKPSPKYYEINRLTEPRCLKPLQ
jgi:hypothetical protein